jgi:hypothetical protein
MTGSDDTPAASGEPAGAIFRPARSEMSWAEWRELQGRLSEQEQVQQIRVVPELTSGFEDGHIVWRRGSHIVLKIPVLPGDEKLV